MNLLDTMKTACVKLTQTTAGDGHGGYTTAWTNGATFYAVIRKDKTPETETAQRNESAEAFTVIVDKTVALNYHDVFRRTSDGAVFRLTSNTMDAAAPAPSTVPIAKATCERWVLPT